MKRTFLKQQRKIYTFDKKQSVRMDWEDIGTKALF